MKTRDLYSLKVNGALIPVLATAFAISMVGLFIWPAGAVPKWRVLLSYALCFGGAAYYVFVAISVFSEWDNPLSRRALRRARKALKREGS